MAKSSPSVFDFVLVFIYFTKAVDSEYFSCQGRKFSLTPENKGRDLILKGIVTAVDVKNVAEILIEDVYVGWENLTRLNKKEEEEGQTKVSTKDLFQRRLNITIPINFKPGEEKENSPKDDGCLTSNLRKGESYIFNLQQKGNHKREKSEEEKKAEAVEAEKKKHTAEIAERIPHFLHHHFFWPFYGANEWVTRPKLPQGSSKKEHKKRDDNSPAIKTDYDTKAVLKFDHETEEDLLLNLGITPWSEWSECSASCGDRGLQIRQRNKKTGIENEENPQVRFYNTQKRICNSFKCSDSIDTLNIEEPRFFKPSPSAFEKRSKNSKAEVGGEKAKGWTFSSPGSYFLLPFRDAFHRDFPSSDKGFVIFITITPARGSEGILFSINGRNSRQEFISMELEKGRLELVHSDADRSRIIDIPAQIQTSGPIQKTHKLAFSVERNGTVLRTYKDCRWLSTQILKPAAAISIPKKADLIVGYMFQGDIEQLTVGSDPNSIAKHCSSRVFPSIEKEETTRRSEGHRNETANDKNNATEINDSKNENEKKNKILSFTPSELPPPERQEGQKDNEGASSNKSNSTTTMDVDERCADGVWVNVTRPVRQLYQRVVSKPTIALCDDGKKFCRKDIIEVESTHRIVQKTFRECKRLG